MKKKADGIVVKVGKFGVDPYDAQTEKDVKLGDFLKEEGIVLEPGEKVWVNGERASLKDILEDKDVVNIVASKEGGR